MFIRSVPDDLDLWAFFGSGPFFENKQDLHFAFQYTDGNNVTAIFSYCEVAGWIQVVLELQGCELSRCLYECVACFEIKKDAIGEFLCAEIFYGGAKSNFSLRVQPFVVFSCSSLEV
ncbi:MULTISPECIES: hypothetical protein [Chromobacterium]|uniref:hypothetical protein n=1 Tax=Chromobacterium TaxID=535 RepID=UPI0013184BF5|nr:MULTISPECIES: hypothetical protein [Chromobacterium]MDH0340184.1 hypothetical protein [Chromobacterium haemolyticum]BBH12829.1 hypothetical protein CH06BL_20770 [Chromobacterium haemolyticum]